MIKTHEQLAVVRSQLNRAEDALVSLHQEVYAKNPRNYAIYGESYVDMILQLRAEIDAFLKIQPSGPDDTLNPNGIQAEDVPVAESVVQERASP